MISSQEAFVIPRKKSTLISKQKNNFFAFFWPVRPPPACLSAAEKLTSYPVQNFKAANSLPIKKQIGRALQKWLAANLHTVIPLSI